MTTAIGSNHHPSHIRESRGDRVFQYAIIALSVVLLVIVAYPLYFTVIASFSKPEDVMLGRVVFWPRSFSVESYKMVIAEKSIWMGYGNTIIYTVLGTALNLLLTIMIAYPLSCKGTPFRGVLTFIASFTMLFSGGLIPTYLLVTRTLGLGNSWWAVIFVGGVSTYNMIIMRTFFMSSIPFELQEAAEIDGCSPFRTLISIILPLSIPVICVIGLYYGVGIWNSYFTALIYLSDKNKWPLQLFLRQILVNADLSAVDGGDSSDMARRAMRAETIKYAICVLASIPMLIIYPFIQRYFVKGVMIGSVKG